MGKAGSILTVMLFVILSSATLTQQSYSSQMKNFDTKSATLGSYSQSLASANTLPEKQPRWSYQSVGTVNVVSVSSNGRFVVAGTSDGYVYLFNSSSNAPLSAVSIGGSVSVVGISYYGKYLAAATGNTLKTYNATSGTLQPLWSFLNVPGGSNEGGIQSLAFSSDGRFLVVGTWKGYYGTRSYVHLFDITNNATLWSATITNANGGTNDYVAVDISSDGQYIVAGSTRNNKVYLFSKVSSTPLYSYDTGASINAVSINSNGNNFVAGGSSIFYFQTNLTVPVWTRNLGGSINSGALETDAAYIVAATGNFLYLLLNDSAIVWSYNIGVSIGSISISSEATYQVIRSGNYAYLFSREADGDPVTSQHEPLWGYNVKAPVNSLSISSDGRYCVVGGGSYLNLLDGSFDPNLIPTVIQFSSNSPVEGDSIVISSTVNNTGNLDSSMVSVRFFFDDILVGTNQILSISKGSSFNTSLSCIVSPSGNHTIKVDVDIGNVIYESNETDNKLTKSLSVTSKPFMDTGANPIVTEATKAGTTKSVSISDSGYYAIAGTSDGYLYMYFGNHTTPVWSYKISGAIDVVGISKEGGYGAFASGNTLYVFSRASNTLLWSFLNVPGGSNEGGIQSLAFSSDGRFLVVGTWKGYYGTRSYVHLFDITNNATLWSATITNANGGTNDYVAVDISSDGQYIVAGSTRNNKVYLFSQTSSTPVYSYDTGAPINTVSMVSDGNNFAAGGNKVYYFNKDIIVPLWSHDLSGTVSSVSISGASTYIVASKANYVYLLKNDNTELWSFNATTSISRTLISRDGGYIIAGVGNCAHLFSRAIDGNVSTSAHDPIWSYDTKNTVNSISTSSDGRYNILGSGGKTFLFDVQHKADLTPTSIKFSSNKPNEGDAITISAMINNTGAYKSYYTNVSFYDGQTLIGKVQIDPLPPNSSTIASMSYKWDFTSLYSLPAGAKKTDSSETSLEESKLLKSLNFNGKGQIAVVKPGETISVDYTYQLWSPSNPSELDQLFFIYSWSPSWPPSDSYYGVYHGGPGLYPGKSGSGAFTLTAPSSPGTYLLYWCYGCMYSIAQAVNEYKQQLKPPGYAKIIVTSGTTGTQAAINEPSSNQTIRVVVDPDNKIWESDKTNNQLTTAIYVNARPTPVTLYNPSDVTAISMKLTWTANTEADFAEYQIYKSTLSNQTGALVATIQDQTKTSYVVSGLTGSTTYYFTVRAADANNAFSGSNQVTASTPPTPVTLFSPSNPKTSSIDLAWTKNTDQVFTRYEIYRSTTQGQLGTLVISITNQSQTTYTVTGLSPSTTYYFTIRVVNPSNLFSNLSQVSGTTAAVPPTPTPVSLSNPSNPTTSSLYLTWSKSNDANFLCYQILMSLEPLQPSTGYDSNLVMLHEAQMVIYDQSATSYNVTGLQSSTTYYSIIRTYNQEGGYADSNVVNAATGGSAIVPPIVPSLDLVLEIIAIGASVLIGALLIRYLEKHHSWP